MGVCTRRTEYSSKCHLPTFVVQKGGHIFGSLSESLLVHTVLLSACLSCHNFIEFNYQFGINYVYLVYSNITSVCVNLVREIKDRLLLVLLIIRTESDHLCVSYLVCWHWVGHFFPLHTWL